MSEQCRRIFIDSRLRSPNSTSNADFSIDLPYEVVCPAGTELRIDGLLMSHSWPTVEAGKNDRLYLREVMDGTSYHRIITIPVGTYSIGTLAVELQAQFRTGTFITDGEWTVVFAHNRLAFKNTSTTASSVLYSRGEISSKVSVEINWTFTSGTVVSTYDWATIWAAANIVEAISGPVADATEMIGLMSTRLQMAPGVEGRCDHIDLARHKALYLCSSSLPSTSMDLRGRGDIIRQIMIGNSAPGEVVVDSLPSMVAFAHFPTFSVLKHISFQVRGYDGEIATLFGHQLSFVIELLRPMDR